MSATVMQATTAAPTVIAAATTVAPTTIVGGSTTLPVPTVAAAPVTYTTAAPAVAAANYVTAAQPVTYAAQPVTYAAQPVTYAAQPASYSPGLIQGASVAAPVVTAPQVVAAPQWEAVAAPSYVAQPMSYLPQQVVAQPVAPKALTDGIPTPDQIKAQKEQYSLALNKQLETALETVKKETEIEKQMIVFNADKQLAMLQIAVEEQRNEQLAVLTEQSEIRQFELRKAYVERKLQLDTQANNFTMDYQVKAVQTELAQKQYQFQQEYASAETKLAQEFNAEVATANTGTTYTVAK